MSTCSCIESALNESLNRYINQTGNTEEGTSEHSSNIFTVRSQWNQWLSNSSRYSNSAASEGQRHFSSLINQPAVRLDVSSDAQPECLMQLPWLPPHVIRLQWGALEFLDLLNLADDSRIPFFCAAEVVALQRLFSLSNVAVQPETYLNLSYHNWKLVGGSWTSQRDNKKHDAQVASLALCPSCPAWVR